MIFCFKYSDEDNGFLIFTLCFPPHRIRGTAAEPLRRKIQYWLSSLPAAGSPCLCCNGSEFGCMQWNRDGVFAQRWKVVQPEDGSRSSYVKTVNCSEVNFKRRHDGCENWLFLQPCSCGFSLKQPCDYLLSVILIGCWKVRH